MFTISNPFPFLLSNPFFPSFSSVPIPILFSNLFSTFLSQPLFPPFSQISFPLLLFIPFLLPSTIFPYFSPVSFSSFVPIPIPSFSPISFLFHISIPYARHSLKPLFLSFFLVAFFSNCYSRTTLQSFSLPSFQFLSLPPLIFFQFHLPNSFIRHSLQSLFPSFSPIPFPIHLSYNYSFPVSDLFTNIFFISCSLPFLQSFSLPFLLSNTFPINISNPISCNSFIGEGEGRNTTPKVVLSYANIRYSVGSE